MSAHGTNDPTLHATLNGHELGIWATHVLFFSLSDAARATEDAVRKGYRGQKSAIAEMRAIADMLAILSDGELETVPGNGKPLTEQAEHIRALAGKLAAEYAVTDDRVPQVNGDTERVARRVILGND